MKEEDAKENVNFKSRKINLSVRSQMKSFQLGKTQQMMTKPEILHLCLFRSYCQEHVALSDEEEVIAIVRQLQLQNLSFLTSGHCIISIKIQRDVFTYCK